MHSFNRYTPWLLTCLSILSVATGMSASPAMMTLSPAPEGFETWEQPEVAFSGKINECPGDLGRDGVFQIAGAVNSDKDPFATFGLYNEFKDMNHLVSQKLSHRDGAPLHN